MAPDISSIGPALQAYAPIVGGDVIDHLNQLALPLKGLTVTHVNSTRSGGGVAEILDRLVPLMNELGIHTRWEVMDGGPEFYQCTKTLHNALQGSAVPLSDADLDAYEETNLQNAERLRDMLKDSDIVFIHDPQPAALLSCIPERKGKWIWRCHIDISHPYRSAWKYMRNHVAPYDASIFSLADFVQPLPHMSYLIPPSIDPLSRKNIELPEADVQRIYGAYDIDPTRPLILQVSRFDRFKDPVGVVEAYRLARKFTSGLQLVLAGGSAADDPEGEAVLSQVRRVAAGDPDIHVLLLPPDAHLEINALQRAADIVLQKSLREGFGLTVTEAMWKYKPVIGGDTGGIRLQVFNHHTGFLVNSPEGAALYVRYLFQRREKIASMGRRAHDVVRENFLLTRHLREYLTLMVALLKGAHEDRIVLG